MSKFLLLMLCLVGLLTASCSKTADPAPAASAAFTLSTSIAEVGEPVQLTAIGQNVTKYEWRSSDAPNNVFTGASPVFSATSTGSFVITLTAYNSENKAVTSSQTIKIGKRYLKEMRLTSLNFLNTSGTAWDIDGSGPDVYLTLKPTASTATATRTATINNVQAANLPLTWSPGTGNTVELTKEGWTFAVLDEDAIGNDYMAGWNVAMNLLPPPARDAFGNGTYTLTAGQYTLLLLYETK
jgi:hypothetical protein